MNGFLSVSARRRGDSHLLQDVEKLYQDLLVRLLQVAEKINPSRRYGGEMRRRFASLGHCDASRNLDSLDELIVHRIGEQRLILARQFLSKRRREEKEERRLRVSALRPSSSLPNNSL